MIIDCDLIASYDFMTDFNGIDRQYPNGLYPAGIYDGEKAQNKYGPSSTEYPNITLAENIYDDKGDYIPAGYYMVVLSDNHDYLNLFQANELKARVKVVKLVEEMKTQEELNEELELIGTIKLYEEKKKLKKLRKAKEAYEAFIESEVAKNYARIEDTGKGYYSLEYLCNGKKALGIIEKVYGNYKLNKY